MPFSPYTEPEVGMFTRKMFTRRNAVVLFFAMTCLLPVVSGAHDDDRERDRDRDKDSSVQVGPRPFYLVDKMSPSPLKRKLEQCSEGPFYKTDFSIGHRGGGTLQFPEHTKESHEAGARMGAGIQECDVTFTKDGQLVCRHDQCDLHTTTNILVTPLAAQCSAAVLAGRVRRQRQAHQGGLGAVLHQRPDRGRVQDPQGQDGRVQSQRDDAAGIPGRHRRTGAPTSIPPAPRC